MDTFAASPYVYQAWIVATIKAELGARGWSVEKLAATAGFSSGQQLGRYMRCQRALSLDQLASIAQALDMTGSELTAKAETRRDTASVVERASVLSAVDPHLSERERMRQSGEAVTD